MAVRAEPSRPRLMRGPLSLVGTTRVLLKRLRADAAVVAAVLVLVGLASFLLAAVPRALGEMTEEGLRYTVAEVGPLQRDIEILRALRIPAVAEEDPLAGVEARGERLSSLLGTAESLVAEQTVTVDAPRYSIFAGPPLPGATRYVTLRQATAALEQVRVVEGRLPGPATETRDVRIAGRPERAHMFETALSRTAAALLAVDAGDTLLLLSDVGDPLVRGVALADRSPLLLRVTGLWEPRDPGSAFWAVQAELNEPRIEEPQGGDHRFVYAYGLFAPAAYGPLTDAVRPMPLQYTWRYAVDPEAFGAARLPALEEDLRRLDAQYGRFVRPTDTYVRTGLPAVLDRYELRRSLSLTLLAMVAIGLLVAALAAVALLASLIVDRRREAIALARSRGASSGQMLAAQAAEAILLAAPVALAAYVLAVLAVDGPATPVSALSVAGFVAATAVLLVALAAGPASRAIPLETRQVAIARPSPRRLALEALVVAVSLAGVYLLRRRGLSGGDGGELDPYLAAVPVLLALAVGLLALRLYPLPLAALSNRAARRRDLMPALGTRRVARRPGGTGVALLVIVLAVAGAVFAGVEAETIDRGHAAVAWARVGADYRIDAGEDGLPPGARDAAGREAEAVAAAWVERRARVVTGGAGTLGGFTLLALEPERYAAVTAGTPLDDGLLAGAVEARPIPAIVSGRPISGATIGVGLPVTVAVQGEQFELLAVERRERIAGMPASEPVVAVPLGAVRSALGERIVRPNRLYVRAGTSAGEALREALPRASVLGRRDVHSSLDDSPLAAGTVDGFRAAVFVGGALAALAVLLAAALTARPRSREVAYLRALGLSGRQALALVAFELVPATVVALAVGILLGIALPHVLAPGIDLTAFTGAEPVITVDPVPVAVLAGSVLAVLGVAVVAAGDSARRAELGRALRAEER